MTNYIDLTPALYADIVRPVAPTVARMHFASLADATATFPATERDLANKRPDAWCKPGFLFNPRESQWSGASHADTVRMVRNGWSEGADRARKVRDGIIALAPIAPRLARYDVAGACPDVRRALAGNPQAMRRVISAEDRRRPIITLQVGIFVSSMMDAVKLQDAAAAIAATIDTLEAGGYRCQVLAVCQMTADSSAPRFSAEIVTQVKAPEAPLSLADAAFICGHPAYFRRVCFFLAVAESRMRPAGDHMGYPMTIPNDPDSHNYRMMAMNGLAEHKTPRAMYFANLHYLAKQGCPGIPDGLPTD